MKCQHFMNARWRWVIGTALWATVTLVVLACSDPPSIGRRPVDRVQLPDAQYVGPKQCLLCHQDKAATLEGTRHWQQNDPRTPLANKGCESCHGPGSAHVEARFKDEGDEESPSELGIVSFGLKYAFPSEQLDAKCLECHQRKWTHWQQTTHAGNNVACVDCHKIHAPEHEKHLKAASTLSVCGSCHIDKRAAMERKSHHPLREGKMECTSCHDPHGTGGDANLKATSKNRLCYECHTEKRGPFLWEHAPVSEDCTTCHDPHGTIHDKLLTANLPYLCQRCHDMGNQHPGTLYGLQHGLAGDSPSARFFGRSCINCHTRIHGSNHPMGRAFHR
ncbi:MAG: DmsE family decaheme c-type cytochrome [Planctomycetes bacterium]|nr:DmsE family decaheme c-type cytochrome [Planctomycetota bacterium]